MTKATGHSSTVAGVAAKQMPSQKPPKLSPGYRVGWTTQRPGFPKSSRPCLIQEAAFVGCGQVATNLLERSKVATHDTLL